MRSLGRLPRLTAAGMLALGWAVAGAGPVAAECPFLPPLPKVSMAIPTARELFVGDVVDEGSGAIKNPVFTVRVTEVFRGSARVGELRHYEYPAPNWPWSTYPGGAPYPSCSRIWARPGEHVILALDARWPGGTVTDGAMTWYQPPTTYNTIGILEGSSREQYGSGGRQLFSIERLREMAAQFPPATDTKPAATDPLPGSGPGPLLLLAATAGAVLTMRHMGRRLHR